MIRATDEESLHFFPQIEELIPNGANIPVNNENRIEYIYRMADYKLNKQIAKQSQAFKKGLKPVIVVLFKHTLISADQRLTKVLIQEGGAEGEARYFHSRRGASWCSG